MGKVTDLINEHIKPIVEQLGYEFADVEYAKKPEGMTLTLYISNDTGISLDDCVKVNNAVDQPLETLDPTNGASYRLNVSSLGLDRKFKTTKDYERYVNKEVEITLFAKLNGKKQYTGLLKAADDSKVVIDSGGTQIEIARKQVASAGPHI